MRKLRLGLRITPSWLHSWQWAVEYGLRSKFVLVPHPKVCASHQCPWVAGVRRRVSSFMPAPYPATTTQKPTFQGAVKVEWVQHDSVNVLCVLAQLCPTLCDPMGWVNQAHLSTGFSRQEYWSSILPCPPPGDLSNPGIEPRSPALQVGSLPAELPGKHKTVKIQPYYIFPPLPGGTVVRNLLAVQETQVWSLGQEDPLEKETETHSSIVAWGSSWAEEPGGLQSMGSQRGGHDWVTKAPRKCRLIYRANSR